MKVSLPIILRPSVGRKIKIVLSSILVGALAALMITLGFVRLSTQPGLSLVVLLIGGAFGLFAVTGLLSVFRTSLILDAEGLTVQHPFKRLSCRWSEVEGDFRPQILETDYQTRMVAMVCWNLKPGSEELSVWRKMKRAMGEASINAMYGGMDAEQLAALLNRVRDDQLSAKR